jgi:hypothetical protein
MKQEMKNLNSTFFSLRNINTDGQIRRSWIARSTVSSKTFERAQALAAEMPSATEHRKLRHNAGS